MLNYFSLIDKYIPKGKVYHIYTIHVAMVTRLALKIARRQNLSAKQLQFIEEACMLHDIGIARTDASRIGCYGELPYIQHVLEGRKILEEEGLPNHARVAANHIGVGGISKSEIVTQKLKLPDEDILCEQIEDKIISYADLFYSKNPKKLFEKKSVKSIREKIKDRPEQEARFQVFHRQFGE